MLKVPVAEDQQIDLCASLAPDGNSIFVTLINEDASNAREVELSLVNFRDLHEASAELLVSQTLEVGGDFLRDKRALAIQDGSKVRVTIPRFSVAGVRLTSRLADLKVPKIGDTMVDPSTLTIKGYYSQDINGNSSQAVH